MAAPTRPSGRDPAPLLVPDRKTTSLFCFMLIYPAGRSLERALVHQHLEPKHGMLAGCDEFAIYSNESGVMRLSSNRSVTFSKAVNGPLDVPRGGRYNVALLAPLYRQVWHTIFRDRRYVNTAWTVKLDPDTVFFAERLRRQLAFLRPEATPLGLFLKNGGPLASKFHGPILVLSRAAVATFAARSEVCDHDAAKIDLDKGEDWYLHICMSRLKVPCTSMPFLLRQVAGPAGCASGDFSNGEKFAAFHPLKRPDAFATCLHRAVAGRAPRPKKPARRKGGPAGPHATGHAPQPRRTQQRRQWAARLFS